MSGSIVLANPLARPVRAAEEPFAVPRFWTDVKIKRAWLAAAAALCLIGAAATGALAFTANPLFLVAAIPLVLASGALILYACSLTDYDSPSELARVRVRAEGKNLQELIDQHGFDRLFAYSILNPAQFEQAYLRHVEGMQVEDQIQFRGYVQRVLNETEPKVPREALFAVPRWRGFEERIRRETNDFEYLQLKARPDFQAIIRYELIDPALFRQSFDRFAEGANMHQILNEYERSLRQIQQEGAEAVFTLSEPKTWKAKVFEETKGLEFDRLKMQFGWRKLIRYQLLSPEELVQSFRTFGDRSKILTIMGEYVQAMRELRAFPGFDLPKPMEWKNKFREETAKFEATTISALYWPDFLLEHQIIEQEEHLILTRYSDSSALLREQEASEQAKQEDREDFAQAQQEIDQKIALHRAAREAELAQMNEAYDAFRNNLQAPIPILILLK